MKRCFLLAFAFLCLLPASYAQLVLNEIASTNDSLLMDQFGGFPDWIELYNNSGSAIPLSGYYLSDDAAIPQKWAFPSGMTIAPFGHVLVFASDSNTFSGAWAHTNFKISSGGETILLSDPVGSLLDQIKVPQILINDSYGRDKDGSTTLVVFDDPTPEASNNTAIPYTGYCDDEVIFSLTAGFYPGSQSLTLSGPAEIRFTRDGSMPDATSQLYTGPITVDTTQVIRAGCFNAGTLFERAYTNTYLINENTIFPVFSLSTDPDNFFDWNTGIYVKGPNANSSFPYFGANFHQDWERPIHVEFFDTSGVRHIVQDAGVKIFGNYSRGNDMKSIRLIARNKYGDNRFDYKFFSDKNISSFKQVVLRNAGDDHQVANMRDPVNRLIARDLELVDGMAYTPSVVFLNGVYWGMHGLREKIHENYMEANHGVPADSVVILNFDGTVAAGDSFDFQAFSQQISNVDMSIQANYDLWQDSVDVWNLADYFIHNIHFVNGDWPWKNVRLWRSTDRKWPIRYISYDLDGTFELFGIGPPQTNKINSIVGSSGMHENLINAFLGNPEYQDYFVNRYADLMNTSFHPANVIGIVDSLETLLSPEMQHHIPRWGNLSFGGWQYYVGELRGFATDRMPFSRNQLENKFSLDGQVDITLAVSPAGAGFIKMNTVYPDTFPWTGVYYDGVPVTMTAYPKPGYTFDHWQSTSLVPTPNANTSLTLNVDVDDTFTAYFTGSPAALELTISEINYNSLGGQNPGDWIELFNYGTAPVDISGWTLRDDQDFHVYTFPSGTVISNNEYLVVCEDLVAFDSVHTTISNRIGELGFSLSNSGDEIRIYNLLGNLILSMAYNDKNGWPEEADGDGNTLELVDPLVSLNDTANWFAGCLLGSPGGPFVGPCPVILPSTEEVVISELNYNSSPLLDAGDWVEIHNYGNAAMDLTGWTIRDSDVANVYTFPAGTMLGIDDHLVVSADLTAFANIFPAVSNVVGPLGFGFSGGGEQIRLLDASGLVVVDITYDDVAPWPTSPDGGGYTLELLDETASLDDGANWFAGCYGGSPGTDYTTSCFVTDLFINEVLVINNTSITDNNGENDSWIELYNASQDPIDIGGLHISNDPNTPALWQIPDTNPGLTTIPVGGFLVLWADNQTAQGILHLPFLLSNSGGELILTDIIGSNSITVDTLVYPAQVADISYGRYPDGYGQLKTFTSPTPGSSNIIPYINDVFINEFLAGNTNTNSDEFLEYDDWVELYNGGATAVDVGGLFITDDLNEATAYQIPTTSPLLTTIQPGGFLLLWCDEQLNQGVLHVDIKLSINGEQIGLFQINGDSTHVVDSLSFLVQTNDISVGRSADGALTFVPFTTPTPNASNGGGSFPVELLNFEGTMLEPHEVLLEWTTASEFNNAYFEVQKSATGNDFQVIGQVGGAGTTTEFQAYSYTDLSAMFPSNYFRLRQVDFDGTFSYSEVIEIKASHFGDQLLIFPNPALDHLWVSLIVPDPSNTYQMTIRDMHGRVILKKRIDASEIQDHYYLDMKDLASGMYQLKLVGPQGANYIGRFVKQ